MVFLLKIQKGNIRTHNKEKLQGYSNLVLPFFVLSLSNFDVKQSFVGLLWCMSVQLGSAGIDAIYSKVTDILVFLSIRAMNALLYRPFSKLGTFIGNIFHCFFSAKLIYNLKNLNTLNINFSVFRMLIRNKTYS